MPQFDFAHVFWPQVAWLALCFAVLYFGVVRLTLPKLGKVVDGREARIAGDLSAAREARATAELTGERYRADLESAREKARAEIAEGKAHAARATADTLATAHEAAEAHIHAAEGRIAKALELAEASLRDVVAESAQAIVARVTGSEPALDTVQAHLKAAGPLRSKS
jgi:F-type H+-transporting ATPase subunit b